MDNSSPLDLPDLLHYIGMANILISIWCVYRNLRHSVFFFKSKNRTGRNLGFMFISAALLYLMLFLLGVGINIELSLNQWTIFNAILGFAMALGGVASEVLYKHFKGM